METFPNPNTESEKSESKARDVIPPESIFQPLNFDDPKFAECVLESSYEIFEDKEREESVMDKILDFSTASSSFYRDEVESKLNQLNAVEDHISDKDTSVNLDSYIEDQTASGNTLNDKSVLQESANVNAESYIEDASNDLNENGDNTVLDGCDIKRNLDMSVEKPKQDGFQQAQNTFVADSPL